MTLDFHRVDWRAVKARSCDCKARYPGPVPANEAAQRASRRSGDTIRPYRCLFGPGAHWHIGHALSIVGMELLAAAKRAMDNDPHREVA